MQTEALCAGAVGTTSEQCEPSQHTTRRPGQGQQRTIHAHLGAPPLCELQEEAT